MCVCLIRRTMRLLDTASVHWVVYDFLPHVNGLQHFFAMFFSCRSSSIHSIARQFWGTTNGNRAPTVWLSISAGRRSTLEPARSLRDPVDLGDQ